MYPRIKWRRGFADDGVQPIVNIKMARGVASHVLDLAEKSGTELAAYKVGSKHLEAVETCVGENGDISGIYGAVRMESELKFENET